MSPARPAARPVVAPIDGGNWHRMALDRASIVGNGERALSLRASRGDRARRLPWRRQVAHILEAMALVAVAGCLACLPVDRASAIGGYFGAKIGPRLGLSRRAMHNLRAAMPENCDAENHRILRAMWENLGRTIGEFPHLAKICAADSGRVEVVNGEVVTALMAANKPAIVFGGHFANWEIGPSIVHRLMGSSVLSVYRAANNPWVDRLLRHRLRSRHAVAKGTNGGRELVRHLRQNGHVAMLVDQKLNDGISVPFFGRMAMTAPAIARLGLRFRCPIVPIKVERIQGVRFRVTVLPPIFVTATGDGPADVLATMTEINALIEGWVRARPEHWLWLHKRWPD